MIPSIQCLLCFHCIICGQAEKNQIKFETHLRQCIPTALPTILDKQGNPSYVCHICNTGQMDFKTTVAHLVTFCCQNYKDKCHFCQERGRRCLCTVQRLKLMNVVKDKINKGREMDLFNHSHRMIYHLSLIHI